MEEEMMNEMLSENFSLWELTRTSHSECPNEPGPREISNLRRLAREVLQPLRDTWGDRLKVSSGYRSLLLNTRVHGARNSYHLRGLAADIDCGTSALKAMTLAVSCSTLQLPVVEAIVSRRGAHYWLHVALRTSDDPKQPVFSTKEY
jgi:uncharacterized protein YcbK (DUF882 family)